MIARYLSFQVLQQSTGKKASASGADQAEDENFDEFLEGMFP